MTDHVLNSRQLNKCGHGSCNCLVDPGVSYCSEQCERTDGDAHIEHRDNAATCNCQHAECT